MTSSRSGTESSSRPARRASSRLSPTRKSRKSWACPCIRRHFFSSGRPSPSQGGSSSSSAPSIAATVIAWSPTSYRSEAATDARPAPCAAHLLWKGIVEATNIMALQRLIQEKRGNRLDEIEEGTAKRRLDRRGDHCRRVWRWEHSNQQCKPNRDSDCLADERKRAPERGRWGERRLQGQISQRDGQGRDPAM